MTIETRYALGQEVFFMRDNRVQNATVNSVRATIWLNGDYEESYSVSYINNEFSAASKTFDHENIHELFPTKEALLASL